MIQFGTLAVTSRLTYAVPHLSGAIDVVMVCQPDGSLRSSPFYVRFGKYSGLRTEDKRVAIVVNGVTRGSRVYKKQPRAKFRKRYVDI